MGLPLGLPRHIFLAGVSMGIENVERILHDINETGCYAMVDANYLLDQSLEEFNESNWRHLLPILEKYSSTIKAIYVADEPFHNFKDSMCKKDFKLCFDKLEAACDFIRQTTRNIFPIAITISSLTLKDDWSILKFPKLPAGLDWIGMDCYSDHFLRCSGWPIPTYLLLLDHLRYEHQKLTIVPPASRVAERSYFQTSNIYSIFRDYYDMVRDIGIEKFALIMPFLWECDATWGVKYFPELGLWWNYKVTNNTLGSSFEFYLDGLIFRCKSADDCRKLFPESVATSVNLVRDNEIHPVTAEAWAKADCGENYNVEITTDEEIAKVLKGLKIGESIDIKSGYLVFLHKSCSLNFEKLP